jgi:DNA-binding MarR family transcriptional regulator
VNDGQFAYEGLDRLLHERARLSVMTALSTAEDGRLFTDLRRLCDLTDGNLNRHLEVLKEHGLVAVKKRGEGRASETRVRLTAAGRKAFLRYLAELERVLRDARSDAETLDAPRESDGPAPRRA